MSLFRRDSESFLLKSKVEDEAVALLRSRDRLFRGSRSRESVLGFRTAPVVVVMEMGGTGPVVMEMGGPGRVHLLMMTEECRLW